MQGIGSSKASYKKRQIPLLLSFFQRLLAFFLFGVITLTLKDFPVAKEWIAFGFGVYLILLWRFPWLWLVVIPAVLPVLDLTPWSGRVFFGEFDLFVLTTCAAGYLRRDSWIDPLYFNRSGWILVLFLVIWQTYTTLNGLLPLQPLDANALTSYYSHYNSLRIAKGFFWALLLLPLLGQSIGRGDKTGKLLVLGILAGLATCLIVIIWERALFTGLFNFNKPYRVTGLFSGMATGGAIIDNHLIFSIPFISALFLVWRSLLTYIIAVILFILSLYGLTVTFSRIDYVAIAISFFTSIIISRVFLGSMIFSHLRPTGYIFGLLTITIILSIPFISGNYIETRFMNVSKELEHRYQQWKSAISLMDQDWNTKMIGMGKGSFPRNHFLSYPVTNLPATIQHQTERDNGFIRMGQSDHKGNLFLTQRFVVREPGEYRLTLSLRPTSNQQVRFLIEVCERLMYLPYSECRWLGINSGSDSAQWTVFNRRLNVDGLGQQFWFGSRPVQIALLNRGLSDVLDIDQIQIVTPSGERLLRNSNFENGLDHWLLYSGDHAAWHLDNVYVSTYFEGGLIGLSIFIIFIYSLARYTVPHIRNNDLLPIFFMPATAGILTIGIFDSLFFYDPRIGLLFFLTTWLVIRDKKANHANSEYDLSFVKSY